MYKVYVEFRKLSSNVYEATSVNRHENYIEMELTNNNIVIIPYDRVEYINIEKVSDYKNIFDDNISIRPL